MPLTNVSIQQQVSIKTHLLFLFIVIASRSGSKFAPKEHPVYRMNLIKQLKAP
jgi:hypothetical protein